jgi:30S ribosomal protein S31
MGKGDKKTKKGKIVKGSYGVRRPRKSQKDNVAKAAPKKENKKS